MWTDGSEMRRDEEEEALGDSKVPLDEEEKTGVASLREGIQNLST